MLAPGAITLGTRLILRGARGVITPAASGVSYSGSGSDIVDIQETALTAAADRALVAGVFEVPHTSDWCTCLSVTPTRVEIVECDPLHYSDAERMGEEFRAPFAGWPEFSDVRSALTTAPLVEAIREAQAVLVLGWSCPVGRLAVARSTLTAAVARVPTYDLVHAADHYRDQIESAGGVLEAFGLTTSSTTDEIRAVDPGRRIKTSVREGVVGVALLEDVDDWLIDARDTALGYHPVEAREDAR